MLDAHCLSLAIYFEARDQPPPGQSAVAEVILNRVYSPLYPDDICSVVYAPAQFSFTANPTEIKNAHAWINATELAYDALTFCTNCPGLNSTHYHASYVSPPWAKVFTPEATIGGHLFYINETPYP